MRVSCPAVRSVLTCVALLPALLGCHDAAPASPPHAPPVLAPTGTGGPAVVQRVEIDLADASLTDIARALANATGRPVVIDPAAQELASCVRVTVMSSGGATPDEMLGIVARALEGSALSLEQSPDGAIVRRVAGASPPESCLSPGEESVDSIEEETASSDARPAPPRDLDGVRRVNPTTFLVSRAARDDAFAEPSALTASVRVVPRMQNGAVDGLALYGIRRASALGQLGFHNGDVLRAINGTDIASPERALEAYARLRNASAYEVRVERRGAPVTLTYRVVERLP